MLRRQVLRGLGALGVSAGMGGSIAGYERQARAFGASPSEASSVMLPENLRAESVLEVFLCGGVSQYESFYCVPEHGMDDGSHFHLYADSAEMAAMMSVCGLVGEATAPFAFDALGQLVHLGPFALPLRERADVMERMRISIVRHDLAPHEAAIPLALSGRGLGNPALAGLGSHIQRYFLDRGDSAGGVVSYALTSNSLGPVPIDNLRALVATGLHPGATRPLSIKVDAAGDLAALLARPSVGSYRSRHDALLQSYSHTYAEQLKWRGAGDTLRSAAFRDFTAGNSILVDVDNIGSILDPASLRLASATSCGESSPADAIGAQLRLAAQLLTDPARPARYVCVVDGGFIPLTNGGGGYDSHTDNSVIQARNLSYTLRVLLDLIKSPDEVAARKIDLSRTLIIINTEFGRSPHAEGSSGRSHWPYGYPVVMMGGPISQPGVVGACDSNAYGVNHSVPQTSRIAALLALGIWPFAQEGFNVSDVPGATSEADAAARVQQQQFGLL